MEWGKNRPPSANKLCRLSFLFVVLHLIVSSFLFIFISQSNIFFSSFLFIIYYGLENYPSLPSCRQQTKGILLLVSFLYLFSVPTTTTRVAPNSSPPPNNNRHPAARLLLLLLLAHPQKEGKKKKKFRLFLLLRRSSHTTQGGGETLWKNQMFQTKRCFYGKHTQIQNLSHPHPNLMEKMFLEKKRKNFFGRKKREKKKKLIFLGFFFFSPPFREPSSRVSRHRSIASLHNQISDYTSSD